MLLRSMPTWFPSGSLISLLIPVSNSTARSGATVRAAALEKRPKYWPARELLGSVELERTKAMPKPGLDEISGKTEKMNWVEKEVRSELGGFLIWVG